MDRQNEVLDVMARTLAPTAWSAAGTSDDCPKFSEDRARSIATAERQIDALSSVAVIVPISPTIETDKALISCIEGEALPAWKQDTAQRAYVLAIGAANLFPNKLVQ